MRRWTVLVCCALDATAAADPAKTVSVRADRAWTPSGLQVKRGQQLTIVARGQVTSDGIAVGPDGVTATQALHVDVEASNPLGTAQPLALIGRIGEGPPFPVGASARITAPRDGALAFGINDERPADNAGEWSVAIYVGTPDKPGEPATELANTTWRHCDGDPHDVAFLSGNQLAMKGAECGAARWKLDGPRVAFDCANVTRYEAALAGDRMTGTWSRVKSGERGALCLQRVVSGAPPTHAARPTTSPPLAKPARNAGSGADKDAVYCVSKVTDAKVQTICAGERDRGPTKPAAASKPVTCDADEYEWEGRCVHCSANSEYVGRGQCRVKPGPVRTPTETQRRWLDSIKKR